MSVTQACAQRIRAASERFVIAGGPGSGKSTLLHSLAAAGEVCYEEASRMLIREQLAQKGRLLPWGDLWGFAQECSTRMQAQLADSARHGRCFFDRGLPDLIGYLSHGGFSAPDAWRAASRPGWACRSSIRRSGRSVSPSRRSARRPPASCRC